MLLGGNITPASDPYMDALYGPGDVADIMPVVPEEKISNLRCNAGKALIGTTLAFVPTSMMATKATASSRMPVSIPIEVTAEDSPTVVFEGDSLTDGRFGPGEEERKMNEQGVTVLAHRHKTGVPLKHLLTQIDEMPEAIEKTDVIVVAGGTNPSTDTGGDLLEVLRKNNEVGSRDGKQPLQLVPELMGNSPRVNAIGRNPVMRAAVDQANAEGMLVEVVPYYDFSRTIEFTADGVHPRRYGELTDYDREVLVPKIRQRHNELFPVITDTKPDPVIIAEPTPAEVAEVPAESVIVAPTVVAKERVLIDIPAAGTSADTVRRSTTLFDVVSAPARAAPARRLLAIPLAGDEGTVITRPVTGSATPERSSLLVIPATPESQTEVTSTSPPALPKVHDVIKSEPVIVYDSVPAETATPSESESSTTQPGDTTIPPATTDSTSGTDSADQVAAPATTVHETAGGFAIPENTAGRPNAQFLALFDSDFFISGNGDYGAHRVSKRDDPNNPGQKLTYKHAGIDFTQRHPSGWTDVLSPVEGVVVSVDHTTNADHSAAGVNIVIATHMDPDQLAQQGIADSDGIVYIQLRELTNNSIPAELQPGSVLAPGQVVGGFGHNSTTGASEGPHVHMSVTSADPNVDAKGMATKLIDGYSLDPGAFGFRSKEGKIITIDGEDVNHTDTSTVEVEEEVEAAPPSSDTSDSPAAPVTAVAPKEEPKKPPVLLVIPAETTAAPTGDKPKLPLITTVVTHEPHSDTSAPKTVVPGTNPAAPNHSNGRMPQAEDVIEDDEEKAKLAPASGDKQVIPDPATSDTDSTTVDTEPEDAPTAGTVPAVIPAPAAPDDASETSPGTDTTTPPPVEAPPAASDPGTDTVPADTAPAPAISAKEQECIDFSISDSGSINGKLAWDFYRKEAPAIGKPALPSIQVAGLIGNLKAEAGAFDPRQVEIAFSDPPHKSDVMPPNVNSKGQPGYGLIQWTSPSRKDGLQRFADETGRPVNDLTVQLEYTWVELSSPYFIDSSLNPLLAATNIDDATEVITRNYEIPAKINAAVKLRQKYARQWFDHCAEE